MLSFHQAGVESLWQLILKKEVLIKDESQRYLNNKDILSHLIVPQDQIIQKCRDGIVDANVDPIGDD